jgi:alanyl-tRNA synthetase
VRRGDRRAYEERGGKEDDEGVIVVGAYAVQSHGAVVVVTDAASITNAAVVHTTELVNLASLAVTPTLNSMKG